MQIPRNRIINRMMDIRFFHRPGPYLIQAMLAGLILWAALLVADWTREGIVVASMGATVFILLAAPKRYVSSFRPVIGGYLISAIVGISLQQIMLFMVSRGTSEMVFAKPMMGAMASSIAIFLMTITNTEHPPASGFALGIVLQETPLSSTAWVLISVGVMWSAKTLLKQSMVGVMGKDPNEEEKGKERPPEGMD